jgi:hypothetical protein
MTNDTIADREFAFGADDMPDEFALAYPTHDEIASLAYSYWEARGCQGGSPEEDWFRAVGELSCFR